MHGRLGKTLEQQWFYPFLSCDHTFRFEHFATQTFYIVKSVHLHPAYRFNRSAHHIHLLYNICVHIAHLPVNIYRTFYLSIFFGLFLIKNVAHHQSHHVCDPICISGEPKWCPEPQVGKHFHRITCTFSIGIPHAQKMSLNAAPSASAV